MQPIYQWRRLTCHRCRPRILRLFYLPFACFRFEASTLTSGAHLLTCHDRPSDLCVSSCQMFFLAVFPPLYLPLTLSFCLHSHCIHQILDSVSYTHQHDIVHRDLKVCVRVSLICICVCLRPPPQGELRGWKGCSSHACVQLPFSFSCL